MKIVDILISKLESAKYNPRIITKEEFQGLKQSLKIFGFVDPAIVNKDMTIIGGHMRIKAWQELGNKTVPCVLLNLDKKQEKKLNILLNSQAISGHFDQFKLDIILGELKLEDNYETLRLDELETKNVSDKDLELKEVYQIIIECEGEHEQQNIFEKLKSEGYKCKPLIL